jgi:hypothetical protein
MSVFLNSIFIFLTLVFKRKENKESTSTGSIFTQGNKESNSDVNKNTNIETYNDIPSSGNKPDTFSHDDIKSKTIHGINPSHSSSENPPKVAGFDFLKKKQPESITIPGDSVLSNISKDDLNSNSSSAANNNNNNHTGINPSSKVNNFKFIKSKNTNSNVISPVSSREINNNLTSLISPNLGKNNTDSGSKKSDFANLDNLLNEKENYYFNSENNLNTLGITQINQNNQNNQNALNNNSNSSTQNANNNDKETLFSTFSQFSQVKDDFLEAAGTNENNILSYNQGETKKSFGFLKKKAEGKNENNFNNKNNMNMSNIKDQENQIKEEDWDNRSLKSLKINNNIKSDNIVMQIDKDEEDNKSIKNVADTSCISNPMKESPSNNAATKTFFTKKDYSNNNVNNY